MILKKILQIQPKLCIVSVPHSSCQFGILFTRKANIHSHLVLGCLETTVFKRSLFKVPPSGPAPGRLSEQVFNCLLYPSALFTPAPVLDETNKGQENQWKRMRLYPLTLSVLYHCQSARHYGPSCQSMHHFRLKFKFRFDYSESNILLDRV